MKIPTFKEFLEGRMGNDMTMIDPNQTAIPQAGVPRKRLAQTVVTPAPKPMVTSVLGKQYTARPLDDDDEITWGGPPAAPVVPPKRTGRAAINWDEE